MEKQTLNLKALILVGGFGTRLRPLTFTKPKPLVELCNKPTLMYQIEALVNVGVNEIVLAINYQPEKMREFIEEVEQKYKVKIVCSKEDTPLGTAGPLGLARDKFFKSSFDHIFVFNADIICDYNLQKLLDYHISKGGEGTLSVTKVKDPSRFGVIVSDKDSKIISFIEKPKEFISDEINAGLYIFTQKFLERIETKPSSIEREVFPKAATDGVLYVMNLEGYWLDIGQPKDFLQGSLLVLNNKKEGLLSNNNKIIGKVTSEEGCLIEEGALVGPNVVLGKNVTIKSGARVRDSVILSGVTLENHCFVEGSIIGWNSIIGKWARIKGLSILGEDVNIASEVSVEEGIILPNVAVKSDVKKNIIMF